MLIPRSAQRLQMVQHAAGPDVHAAVRLVVLVPRATVLRPHTVLAVPGVQMRVDLRRGCLLRFHRQDVFTLHLVDALQRILELDFVLQRWSVGVR